MKIRILKLYSSITFKRKIGGKWIILDMIQVNGMYLYVNFYIVVLLYIDQEITN